MPYITDLSLFEQITKLAKIPLGTSSRSIEIRILEWGEFSVGGFWPYVVELAKMSLDNTLYFWDVNRSMDDTFHKSFGKYPAIALSTSMTEQEYLDELGGLFAGKDEQWFVMNATDSYLLAPASGAWRISGEYATERGKIISTVGLPPDELFPHDFLRE
ncbi:hypothetical protein AWB74_03416 [Caballeronia arvi]|uniref:Uncharacterized protein n=1 Tax=Caballeronia arvi TaxID=1777135 RepID=A0A158J6P1_9BURK|nr:hypothetical protein [Caballeronia arvi]SAL64000.1 hypothetical protein AWB74_03416 [Caballeronia arvi]